MSTVPPTRTAQQWAAEAARLRWPRHLIIDGSLVSSDVEPDVAVQPRDGRTTMTVPRAATSDLDAAVVAARQAFDTGPWPRLAPAQRRRILLDWADLIERQRDELALMISLEMGKPITEAWTVELRAVLATYRWYAELIDKSYDEIAPTGPDALATITREPVGVVGVVTPWNFPLTLAAWKIAPALAVGCTVVHKPSELTSLSALRIAELGLEAGLPPGVLNVVPGPGPELGPRLGLHPLVDALAFTGSTAVGRAYLRYAADSNLKRTWLELGGKSPNIILPDAPDLAAAIDTAVWGVCFNAGQMCTAASRLIVHRDIADQVVAGIAGRLPAYRPADPLDPTTILGPLASGARQAAVRHHVRTAVAEGLSIAAGGEEPDLPEDLADGSYVTPTVFTDVPSSSTLAAEEVFGPVLAITTVTDVDEAVAAANDTSYGLAAGLWTADLSTAHRVSRQLRAGTVWVNCYEEGDLAVPFGGYKLSGNGRDKSAHALDKYTELKTTYFAL